MRWTAIASLGAAIALAASGPATAATTVGQTLDPTPSNCGGNFTWLQVASQNSQYTIPFDGVITSWSHLAGPTPPTQLRLKLGSVSGSRLTVSGQSGIEFPVANAPNTFGTRITAREGDSIGFYFPTSLVDCGDTTPAHVARLANGDVQPGTDGSIVSTPSIQLDVSAVLEPDCDSDGFGDETQDSDLSSCPPAPETTITKGPEDRTKKKTATFEFTANEPGASFECSLDGSPFAPCSSPHSVKVKPGTHNFQVRAADAGGNVEDSLAFDDWKRKKKKKK